MLEADAIKVAQRARDQGRFKAYTLLSKVERRIIEITESGDADVPGKIRDAKCWVVEFKKSVAWVEYAVDELKQEVVRCRWSR